MVAGQGVDGLGIILIGDAKFLQVLIYVPGRVDDVTADDHELRTFPHFEQRRHQSELRLVSFTGVAYNEKTDRLEIRAVDDEVLRDIETLPLGSYPATAIVVNGIAEEASDQVVAPRLPQQPEVKLGKMFLLGLTRN